jgi:hypothetical protein
VRGALRGARDLVQRTLDRLGVAAGVGVALGQMAWVRRPASGVFSW